MSKILEAIIKRTAKEFCSGREKEILKGSRGNNSVALARQVAMWVYKYDTRCTAVVVAETFGRHSSTVSFALSKVELRMAANAKFRARVNALCKS